MKNPRSVTHCGHDVISRGGVSVTIEMLRGEGSIGESPTAWRRRSPRHTDMRRVCGRCGGVKCGLAGLSLPLHDRPSSVLHRGCRHLPARPCSDSDSDSEARKDTTGP